MTSYITQNLSSYVNYPCPALSYTTFALSYYVPATLTFPLFLKDKFQLHSSLLTFYHSCSSASRAFCDWLFHQIQLSAQTSPYLILFARHFPMWNYHDYVLFFSTVNHPPSQCKHYEHRDLTLPYHYTYNAWNST